MVDAQPCDPEWGRVDGGGERLDSTTITLTAVPARGYAFSHWNDGDTTNPRQVYLVSDTAFTAYFTPKAAYRVEAVSSHPFLASVSGGGVYYDQDTAYLQAMTTAGVTFESWNDGDTTNPRTVVVTSDTTFTASFRLFDYQSVEAPGVAQFSISPNPAHNYFVLTCRRSSSKGELIIHDASGREVRRMRLEGSRTKVSTLDLDSGLYFVTLTTPQGSSSQKLVIE